GLYCIEARIIKTRGDITGDLGYKWLQTWLGARQAVHYCADCGGSPTVREAGGGLSCPLSHAGYPPIEENTRGLSRGIVVRFSAVIEIIAITIWVGGMAALALIAAPSIFQTASSREQAGKTFSLILKRFHPVMYLCGTLILIAGLMRWAGVFNHHLYASE